MKRSMMSCRQLLLLLMLMVVVVVVPAIVVAFVIGTPKSQFSLLLFCLGEPSSRIDKQTQRDDPGGCIQGQKQ